MYDNPTNMPTERIKQLLQFYEEDPGDPFNLYALALEYLPYDAGRSRELLEKLLAVHAGYLPTYYHAAKFFQQHGESERAATIFEDGMALAKKLNDQKAFRELRSAYDEMMFE